MNAKLGIDAFSNIHIYNQDENKAKKVVSKNNLPNPCSLETPYCFIM